METDTHIVKAQYIYTAYVFISYFISMIFMPFMLANIVLCWISKACNNVPKILRKWMWLKWKYYYGITDCVTMRLFSKSFSLMLVIYEDDAGELTEKLIVQVWLWPFLNCFSGNIRKFIFGYTMSLNSFSVIVLGCTPQDYKPCTCQALRLKKEPKISNRDINSLMNEGAYTSETRSWSYTPLCAVDGG